MMLVMVALFVSGEGRNCRKESLLPGRQSLTFCVRYDEEPGGHNAHKTSVNSDAAAMPNGPIGRLRRRFTKLDSCSWSWRLPEAESLSATLAQARAG